MCKQTGIRRIGNTKSEREIHKAASKREITVTCDTSTRLHEKGKPYKKNNTLPRRLRQDYKAMALLTDKKMR